MTDAPHTAAPALPSSGRLIATLGTIAAVSGLLVITAYQVTLSAITRNQQEALAEAVGKVLPGTVARSNFLVSAESLVAVPEERVSEANVFAGYGADGALIGLALEGSARGYADVVRILYGYAPARECIVGITVLQSTETPGIGDRVEKDEAFLGNFECLDARLNAEGTALLHEIRTVKHGKKTDPWQIDGISGATITSTAIGKALRDSTSAWLPLLARHGLGPKGGP